MVLRRPTLTSANAYQTSQKTNQLKPNLNHVLLGMQIQSVEVKNIKKVSVNHERGNKQFKKQSVMYPPPLYHPFPSYPINHSILPLNQLNNPFVPSLSQTLLCGTRNVFPSTKSTSKGNNPSSGGSFPISLSLKSSSSIFHPGTSLLPLNCSATVTNPSKSEILFPLNRR